MNFFWKRKEICAILFSYFHCCVIDYTTPSWFHPSTKFLWISIDGNQLLSNWALGKEIKEALGNEKQQKSRKENMWKWFFWGLFSSGGILWWHVNFDGLKKSCVSRATAAAAKLGLSDNNIWLLGVDRAEVSSLKIWWNGSRRGNREFKGFHHLRLLSGSPTKPVPHSKDYKPTVGSTLPIHFYHLPKNLNGNWAKKSHNFHCQINSKCDVTVWK